MTKTLKWKDPDQKIIMVSLRGGFSKPTLTLVSDTCGSRDFVPDEMKTRTPTPFRSLKI
jgi:hypothetical protein